MYYRRPGFCLFPLPYPPPSHLLTGSCVSFSVFLCVARRAYRQGGYSEGSGKEPNHRTTKSIVLYNPLHTLWIIRQNRHARKGPLFGVGIFAIDILLVLNTHTAVTLKKRVISLGICEEPGNVRWQVRLNNPVQGVLKWNSQKSVWRKSKYVCFMKLTGRNLLEVPWSLFSGFTSYSCRGRGSPFYMIYILINCLRVI